MADHLSPDKRSWNMSRIHDKNTKPEIIVRKYLHSMGFRFRLYRKDLPGKPDIVLPKYKTVVFVHGCFWHRHEGCKRCTIPKSNTAYWQDKFKKNIERDKKNINLLQLSGWNVIIIWECEVNNPKILQQIVKQLKDKECIQ